MFTSGVHHFCSQPSDGVHVFIAVLLGIDIFALPHMHKIARVSQIQ
jgi:hypothetical protein